jgi:hypothetical protein
MTSVYALPMIAVEQFRPVCWRKSPEIHFEFAPARSCGGSVAAAPALATGMHAKASTVASTASAGGQRLTWRE